MNGSETPQLAGPASEVEESPDTPKIELPLATEIPHPLDSAVSESTIPPTTPTTSSDIQHPSESPKALHRDRSNTRLLLTLSVGFVSLFLFLRTFAVEPFGVPTGSMAPALIGNHREGACPRCGFPVRVGFPVGGTTLAEQFGHVGCPNCGKKFALTEGRDLNGDRLLVDKNVFNLRSPRRWEMAVFHCPDPDPKEFGKPYVKRVIGLPGETVRIIDGDVYANGILMRKDLAEVRQTRVLIYAMGFVPELEGWKGRWLMEPRENDPRLPQASDRALETADSSVLDGVTLTLDASNPAQPFAGVRYRNWNLDDRTEEPIRAWSSYDGDPRSFKQLPAVHDFSLECDVEVISASQEATFECGLNDGLDLVLAEIAVGPKANGLVTLTQHGTGGLGAVRGVSLEAGHTYRVQFAFVDRRVSIAVDGKLVLPPADLPQVSRRGEVAIPVRMRARACRLAIRNFTLYRDTYYTQFGEHGTQHPAVLGPKEFFMLGDNSGNSQDSRKWPTPGVPETDFIGKPFLIHQPLRSARVSIGGHERVFQTIDWSRLRWLH